MGPWGSAVVRTGVSAWACCLRSCKINGGRKGNHQTIWCTPTNGLFSAAARDLAASKDTLRQPAIPGHHKFCMGLLSGPIKVENSPGPLVKAIPSIASIPVPASSNALRNAIGCRARGSGDVKFVPSTSKLSTHHVPLVCMNGSQRLDATIHLVPTSPGEIVTS